MSLVDVDSWLTEYESCARLSDSLSAQLLQRDKRQALSAEHKRLTNAIQVGLKQFETELLQLQAKLQSTQLIATDDYAERAQQVQALQQQLRQLQLKFNSNARNELLGGGDEFGAATSSATSGAAIIDTSDINSLKQRQIDIMEQQNRGLEVLSQTISRQRSLATQLGQEVDDQNDILDNLANTMERVESRVTVETTNISHVNRRDSTWGYWLTIVLLFIGIMLTVLL